MQNETFTDINGFCPILFRQKELLMSIDGVGRVAAANMIITTEAFTHFDAPREFNWYGGVAPSSYSSGIPSTRKQEYRLIIDD